MSADAQDSRVALDKASLSWTDVYLRAEHIAQAIHSWRGNSTVWVYGVPKGGIPAAQAVLQALPHSTLAETPTEATVIVDDIIDSGATMRKYTGRFPNKPFYSLVDKRSETALKDCWVSFPWERMQHDVGPEENIKRLLQFLGEDPCREGLKDTPKRVVKAWREMLSGYQEKPEEHLTVFSETSQYDEMVVLKNMEFVSWCEHHMLPFTGKAAIAYIPTEKVIGISKLARMFEVFSSRLQIQERLCKQVTEALDKNLQPQGSACIIEASHMCMVCRGVKKQHSKMITASLTGLFKEDDKARNELMNYVTRE